MKKKKNNLNVKKKWRRRWSHNWRSKISYTVSRIHKKSPIVSIILRKEPTYLPMHGRVAISIFLLCVCPPVQQIRDYGRVIVVGSPHENRHTSIINRGETSVGVLGEGGRKGGRGEEGREGGRGREKERGERAGEGREKSMRYYHLIDTNLEIFKIHVNEVYRSNSYW